MNTSHSLAKMVTDIMIDTKLAIFANMTDSLHTTLSDLVMSAPGRLSPSQTLKGGRHWRARHDRRISMTGGYIAPKFEEKEAQKVEGQYP